MSLRRHSTRLAFILFLAIVTLICFLPEFLPAATEGGGSDPPWTIYYRPGVRFGSDNRTLYINDFLIPIYQDDKNILFNNTKFTPNDQNGWEVNVGIGYRRLLLDDRLILGVNGFYDQRKTPWGTYHEQWGLGTEVMADVPVGRVSLGLTGRFNYYWPLTSAKIETAPNPDARFEFKGHGIYALDPLINAYVEEPLRGCDAELGIRVPYVSDYVETWVYGGG